MTLDWSEVSEHANTLPPGACPNCGGEGQEPWPPDETVEPSSRTCPDCKGTGNAKEVIEAAT